MSRRKNSESAQASNMFQFSLAGLIIFSLALIAGATFIGFKLATGNHPRLAEAFAVDPKDKTRSIHVGPWGELITRDIGLERPAEFLTEEVANPTAGNVDVQWPEARRGQNIADQGWSDVRTGCRHFCAGNLQRSRFWHGAQTVR